MTSSIFVAATLEQAAVGLLQQRFPEFLREIEKQYDMPIGEIPAPVSYTQRNSFEGLPGEEIPKCVVISPGIIGVPEMFGNGQYSAVWRLGVGVAVAAPTEERAELLAQIYGAAVRAIFLAYPSVGGISSATRWIDESYADIPLTDKIQQYKASNVWFATQIPNVATGGHRGRPMPDDVTGVADTVDVDLNKLPIGS